MSGRKLRAANHALTTTNRAPRRAAARYAAISGHGIGCAGVAAEEPPSGREATREHDMKDEADEQR